MEREEMLPETDAEPEAIRPESGTEKGAGIQPRPAVKTERELDMTFAAVLKSTFQKGGEAAVRGIVDEILSRRGTPQAKTGEQMALRAAMDELEEDSSDEAGQILNIIFGCYDAAEFAREQKYSINRIENLTGELRTGLAKMVKLTGELVTDVVRIREEGAFGEGNDDTWGATDLNGDPCP